MAEQTLMDFAWGHANRGGQNDWPFVMALRQGFFQEEGINLRIRVVPGGDALAEAIGRGEIQLGRMGTPPFLTAVGRGVRSGRIIASSVIGNLDHFFWLYAETCGSILKESIPFLVEISMARLRSRSLTLLVDCSTVVQRELLLECRAKLHEVPIPLDLSQSRLDVDEGDGQPPLAGVLPVVDFGTAVFDQGVDRL